MKAYILEGTRGPADPGQEAVGQVEEGICLEPSENQRGGLEQEGNVHLGNQDKGQMQNEWLTS